MTYEYMRPTAWTSPTSLGNAYADTNGNYYDNSVGDTTTSSQVYADSTLGVAAAGIAFTCGTNRSKAWKQWGVRIVWNYYSNGGTDGLSTFFRVYHSNFGGNTITIAPGNGGYLTSGGIVDQYYPRSEAPGDFLSSTIYVDSYAYSTYTDSSTFAQIYDLSLYGIVDEQRHFLCM